MKFVKLINGHVGSSDTLKERKLRKVIRGIIQEITNSNYGASGQNNSSRYTPVGQKRTVNYMQLSGYEQIEFPVAQDPIGGYDSSSTASQDLHIDQGISAKYNNKVRRDSNQILTIGGRDDSMYPRGVMKPGELPRVPDVYYDGDPEVRRRQIHGAD